MAMAVPRRTKIEKIEHLSSRQVTFSKRRKGLFNKADDFSTRCGAEIAIIVFSNTKKMYEYSSTNMEDILSRYINERAAGSSMESSENMLAIVPSPSSDRMSSTEIGQLQEEIRALNLDCSRLKGMELDGMSLRDLNELEKQIREGIESVEKRKMEVGDYYQPTYMLEDSDPSNRNNNNFLSGSSSSAASGCTELEQSIMVVDTGLHL